jgi:hypothetical protein
VRAVVPYYFKSPYPYANSAVREPAICLFALLYGLLENTPSLRHKTGV